MRVTEYNLREFTESWAAHDLTMVLLWTSRLDPDRPQREALWKHSGLPSGWQPRLAQRAPGCPGASGRSQVLLHPRPHRTLSIQPAGQTRDFGWHAVQSPFEICRNQGLSLVEDWNLNGICDSWYLFFRNWQGSKEQPLCEIPVVTSFKEEERLIQSSMKANPLLCLKSEEE